jgi:hypothetical protein
MLTHFEALLKVLTNPAYHFKRIGLEAGPLSQWLFSVLAEAGLPAIYGRLEKQTYAPENIILFRRQAK